jgi:hypothetical protein
MKKQRFPSWQPKMGERAIVPAGPAGRHYIDVLDAVDVAQIKAGHRGYMPLRVVVKAPDGRVLDGFVWSENYGFWENIVAGDARTLPVLLRAVRRYYGQPDAYLDSD